MSHQDDPDIQTMAEPSTSAPTTEEDPILTEIKKKVADAFDTFDHESNKTVDVREVGTIVRSLDCFPSEADLADIISEVEEEEPTGFVRYEKFEPVLCRILLEHRYQPVNEEQLLKAFKVLDVDKRGHLTKEELTKVMKEEGEPFTDDEFSEMWKAAVQDGKQLFMYHDFVPSMLEESKATIT